jgi:Ca-activated chloride channel family protein
VNTRLSLVLFSAMLCAQDRVAITPRARKEPALAATRASLRLDVRMVQVPVIVTDFRGAPVMGLPASNFRVFEDESPRAIAALSVSEAPISAGIVFDTSRSMRPRLEHSRQALEGFLKTSAPADEFFLVRFSDRPELLASFTQRPDDILAPLTSVEAKGWTALNDAVMLAAQTVRKGRHARHVLVVITDGDDNNSRYSDSELVSLLREADVQVYAISLIERSRFLQRICDETGGRSVWVHRMADLPSAMEELSRQIRSEYLISFRPADGQDDGRYHKVRIEVDPPEGISRVFASWRRGYYE